ncbi:hypothetical protein [Kaistella yonginensis]|uniref:alpha-glutamyl/putrescinyl thymine pyrophosphorylase clade 3 protein n=1 Tax=Kaistella yonginensis TaxID=658267 RepID=UPI0025B45FD3|nr:hypothetical protein [Kaistella yonginensis]MDN3607697.1 hypothetical protein [Kaistella yonginensis]
MKNSELYRDIETRLLKYKKSVSLPGIIKPEVESNFIRQFIDSYKRIKFIEVLKSRPIDIRRKNPNSDLFDPIQSAILHYRENNINEAVWNILLYVHFGKTISKGYGLLKAVYGNLGKSQIWSLENFKNDISGFRDWLDDNQIQIKNLGGFGNHRKYQSIRANAKSTTYQTLESFLTLINNDFETFISSIPTNIKSDKYKFFDYLFKHFGGIVGFARLAIFDFLCMIGKVGILDIEPAHPYLGNSGPVTGAKLLFGDHKNLKELNIALKDLGDNNFVDYPFRMQILEDSICNWQKKPGTYKLFNG